MDVAPTGRTPARAAPPWWFGAAMVIAIIVAYQPTWDAQFIWDDDAHLTAHPGIIGPRGLEEIWTTAAANYFPLVLTTFWTINRIFGLDPLVFHLTGVVLHIGCTLLLWVVLRRLRIPGAAVGAALWGLHPVQVESVAWVSEIINTQSGAFFLASVWFGCRWLAPDSEVRPRSRDYALSLVCAVGAMLSKPSTVMLPVVLGLCAWWLRGRVQWRDATWLAPFFVLALATSGWAIWEQKVHQGATGADWELSLAERVIVAGNAVWFYAGKLGWPHPLSFIYPRWSVDSTRLIAWLPALAAVVTIGLLGWNAWRRGGAWRGGFFAAAYHVVLLFPVLGFFDVYFFRYSFVADHFQYLAGMGLLALAGAAVAKAHGALTVRGSSMLVPAAAGAVLLLFAVLSWRHARHFVNDETLWRATLRTNPSCVLAHNNLGVILAGAGRHEDAIGHYRAALAVNPRVAETHLSLAQALTRLPGRTDEALRHFEIALELKPTLASAHSAYATLLAGMPGRRDDAIRRFEAALRLRPNHAEDHTNLGIVLTTVGRLDKAIAHGETAITLKPTLAEAHFNLANSLARVPRRLDDAVRHYERAIQIKPDYVKAHINLGLLFARDPGRLPDAIRQYEAALAADERSAAAHNNLAIALAHLGRGEDARRHFERALEIDPEYTDARNNLSILLGGAGGPNKR